MDRTTTEGNEVVDDITKNYIKYLEDRIDKCYETISMMQAGLDVVHDVVDHICMDTFPLADDIIPADWKPRKRKPPKNDDR